MDATRFRNELSMFRLLNDPIYFPKLIYHTTPTPTSTPEPVKEERWKNRTYKEFCENLGVMFRVEGDEIYLDEVEESDVAGKPCLAKVVMNEYETRDGETKRTMQVSSVTPWKDGVELSSDELDSDLPF